MIADGDSYELAINIHDSQNDADFYHMDTSMCECNGLVMQIGKVVSDLRSLGFTSMAEDAYSFAIFLLLKVSEVYVITNYSNFITYLIGRCYVLPSKSQKILIV